jgi:DNA-binding NtrC family response regulator
MAGKTRVLVVDDNRDLLTTFTKILEKRGYGVETADDGFDAVDKFRSNHFDIVLMDILMPGISGVETLKRIKRINPKTKVVLMTAYCDEKDLKTAEQEGAFRAIHKPVDIHWLLNLIQETTDNPPVLIVDDDPAFCRILGRTMELKGYRVQIANSGREALKLVAEHCFQIAFLDIKMPDIDGLETYLKLKEISPDTVAVMMTGYRDEMNERIKQGLAESSVNCIYKPFDIGEALILIDQSGRKDERKN